MAMASKDFALTQDAILQAWRLTFLQEIIMVVDGCGIHARISFWTDISQQVTTLTTTSWNQVDATAQQMTAHHGTAAGGPTSDSSCHIEKQEVMDQHHTADDQATGDQTQVLAKIKPPHTQCVLSRTLYYVFSNIVLHCYCNKCSFFLTVSHCNE